MTTLALVFFYGYYGFTILVIPIALEKHTRITYTAGMTTFVVALNFIEAALSYALWHNSSYAYKDLVVGILWASNIAYSMYSIVIVGKSYRYNVAVAMYTFINSVAMLILASLLAFG